MKSAGRSKAQALFHLPQRASAWLLRFRFWVGATYLMKGPPLMCPSGPPGSKSFGDKTPPCRAGKGQSQWRQAGSRKPKGQQAERGRKAMGDKKGRIGRTHPAPPEGRCGPRKDRPDIGRGYLCGAARPGFRLIDLTLSPSIVWRHLARGLSPAGCPTKPFSQGDETTLKRRALIGCGAGRWYMGISNV